MDKKQKITNKNDWAQFALGYLHLANLACMEIDEKKHNNEDFNIKSIYIPALFNLKHGIEVFLKALCIEFLQKESLNQSDYSHDIEEIFLKLKTKVKKSRLKVAIEKYKKRILKKRNYLAPIQFSMNWKTWLKNIKVSIF